MGRALRCRQPKKLSPPSPVAAVVVGLNREYGEQAKYRSNEMCIGRRGGALCAVADWLHMTVPEIIIWRPAVRSHPEPSEDGNFFFGGGNFAFSKREFPVALVNSKRTFTLQLVY